MKRIRVMAEIGKQLGPRKSRAQSSCHRDLERVDNIEKNASQVCRFAAAMWCC